MTICDIKTDTLYWNVVNNIGEYPLRPLTDDKLVLYLESDWGNNITWNDLSSNNDAIMYASSRETIHNSGIFGNGFKLDGINSYGNIGDLSTFNYTGDITVSTTVQFLNFPSICTETYLLSKTGSSNNRGWGLYAESMKPGFPNNVAMFNISDLINSWYCNGNTKLNTNTIYNITGVYNSSVPSLTIYLDGINDTRSTSLNIPPTMKSPPVIPRLGWRSDGITTKLNAIIYRQLLYTKALSPNEVMYNHTHSPSYYIEKCIT